MILRHLSDFSDGAADLPRRVLRRFLRLAYLK